VDVSDDLIVETIPLPGVRADDGPGTGPPCLVGCNYDHALEVAAYLPNHHGIDPVQRLLLPPDRLQFCASCAWCGRIVARPDRCILHDDGCPDVDLERTVLITDAVSWVAVMLHSSGFQRYCPDSILSLLVEEASTQLVFYQARGGDFLGGIVLRKAGIPEPPPPTYDPGDEPF
jgi:hypothetical protein